MSRSSLMPVSSGFRPIISHLYPVPIVLSLLAHHKCSHVIARIPLFDIERLKFKIFLQIKSLMLSFVIDSVDSWNKEKKFPWNRLESGSGSFVATERSSLWYSFTCLPMTHHWVHITANAEPITLIKLTGANRVDAMWTALDLVRKIQSVLQLESRSSFYWKNSTQEIPFSVTTESPSWYFRRRIAYTMYKICHWWWAIP